MKLSFAIVISLLMHVFVTARLSVMKDDSISNIDEHKQHHAPITTSSYSKVKEANTYKDLSDHTSIDFRFRFEPNEIHNIRDNVNDNKKIDDRTSASSGTDNADVPVDSSTIHNRDRQQRHLLPLDMECVLYLKTVMFMPEDVSSKRSWSCEFTKEQALLLGIGKSMTIMDIDGVTFDLLESKNAVSGESVMKTNMMMITSTTNNGGGGERERTEITDEKLMKLFVPDNGQNIIVKSLSLDDKRHSNYYRQRRHRRRQEQVNNSNTGILKTLVVRVTDSVGIRMKADTSQLVGDVFTDSVSLRTQYAACSKDQLLIEPATFVGDGTGIVDVTIDIAAAGQDKTTIQYAAVSRAEELYGGTDGLAAQFDLVMFCQPESGSDWLAYTYVNRWGSFYNNINDHGIDDSHWCQKVAVQMHEGMYVT
jgi:hypothetical protein